MNANNSTVAMRWRWSIRRNGLRLAIAAVLASGVLTPSSPAQSAAGIGITGVYNGTYTGGMGRRTLKLALQTADKGTLTGVFTFYLPPTSHDQAYSFILTGKFDVASGKFTLEPVRWQTQAPGYSMVGLAGTFDPRTGRVAGNLTAGMRGPFEATRDAAESANVAHLVPTLEEVNPSLPVSKTPPAPEQVAAASLTGVYNGTYVCTRVPLKVKLSLVATPDGSVTGFFIVDPPPDSGGRFIYKLNGRFAWGVHGFNVKAVPWGPPAPSDCSMRQVIGQFSTGSDMISGVIDNPSRSDFHLTRDKAESPTEIALALQSEPAPTAQASTPPPSPAAPVTEQSAATSRAVVLICRYGPGGLTGLPVPDRAAASGKAAVNDGDWIARLTQRLKEHAQERKWDILAPYVSEDHSCASINVALPYKFDSSNAVAAVASIWKLTGEIPTPAGLRINSIYASPPPSVAQVALAKAQDERVVALRAAPPAQLASKYLVRKSKAYWDAYRTDLIRQIFDGGFGSDVDDIVQFRILFCSYVEMFSENCRADLLAHHESVTITQTKVTVDQHGNVTGSEIRQSYTVEVDSRFVPKYRQFAESLSSSSSPEIRAGAFGIALGRVSLDSYFAPGLDMMKFFATEKCQSAAMRQLGENLLRGATGQLSLQQVGEKIAGAAAETDKDLPPGRYARFVDGCNGFYRDPANARLAGLHSSAWCQCLGEKYQHQMSRDEEYYYANDFEKRFLDEIAEPKQRTDPNWTRLHPACDGCRQ